MIIEPAHRTETVKEYYFSRKNKEIAALNAERAARGEAPVINLGIGAPDGMPPAEAIEALVEAARKRDSHIYQSYIGLPALRQAFADWYSRYYGVSLPLDGIQPLFGSKEGILLISLAFLNKGDKVLIPDPGYPTYSSASALVEAEPLTYNLIEDNGWLPDFEALEKMNLDGVKIMWTNYPNMPTGANATPELYRRLADFGRRHRILIVNDNPYSFILNDRPLSLLAAPGAMECCLELNSLSKAHNMSGWRLGMVGGSPELIEQVLKVKSQMDSGMFKPMQLSAIAALSQGPEWFEALNAVYRRRKAEAARIFDTIGAHYDSGTSGLFLWGRIDADNPLLTGNGIVGPLNGHCGVQDISTPSIGERVSDRLLREAGVFITPGFVFGRNGASCIRISLCAEEQVFAHAHDLIKSLMP